MRAILGILLGHPERQGLRIVVSAPVRKQLQPPPNKGRPLCSAPPTTQSVNRTDPERGRGVPLCREIAGPRIHSGGRWHRGRAPDGAGSPPIRNIGT